MVNLPRGVASVWTSNPKVADVYVNSPRQVNLFGKDTGEATIIATAADGSVVYGANVRVNQNISDINDILHQAMPESNMTFARSDRLPSSTEPSLHQKTPPRPRCWSRQRSTRVSTSTRTARH